MHDGADVHFLLPIGRCVCQMSLLGITVYLGTGLQNVFCCAAADALAPSREDTYLGLFSSQVRGLSAQQNEYVIGPMSPYMTNA
jgi:hypothetical protein